ncbi:FolC bifunctional protein [Zopfia rhizophila CBS 207.26]|uniref:tetrahydrofolate synthase n=1 Tax=Zopfia rhizophila CBS 207.26 TaxID=1314779 RepID=A0A6A6DMZ6_9PEZI|nr:FolC bifunctional protein [Zopfia rhizophila CBS 207.26]
MLGSYADAIRLLRSRSQPLFARPIKNHPNNLQMREWLEQLGHKSTEDLDVVHITGTKGKGSTAAFTESLLRAHFRHVSKPVKIGLYTSPHLITERERIRINFQPLSESVFTQYFYEIWNTLLSHGTDEKNMPGYLQLLALLSIHVFKREMVDVAIYEVHAGGRKDATNVFDHTVVCGFTTIGLDHTDFLGPTIKDIAWHKSGIMKPAAPAFSVAQEPVARDVLEKEASRLGCPIKFVEICEAVPEHSNLRLRAQKTNASLAIWLAKTYLSWSKDELSVRDIHVGLTQCNWPGRFHVIEQDKSRWFLDCAHNSLSLPVTLEWFESEARPPTRSQQNYEGCSRILIFGHESKRNSRDLIKLIVRYCKDHEFAFNSVILAPYERYGSTVHDAAAEEHAAFWREIQGLTPVSSVPSLADALVTAKQQSTRDGVLTLITGSTHLVGQALGLLQEGR